MPIKRKSAAGMPDLPTRLLKPNDRSLTTGTKTLSYALLLTKTF